MALILGVFGLIGCILTLKGTRERHEPREEDRALGVPEFFKVLKQVFADKQVLVFSIMILLVQMPYQLMLLNVPYMTTLILELPVSWSSYIIGNVTVLTGLSTMYWYRLMKKFPKRTVFRGIIITMIAGFVLCYFIGSYPVLSPIAQAFIMFSIVGAGVGGMFLSAILLIADITDYDELKFGKRREAVYYGIYGIVRKTGWALCTPILYGIYTLFGWSVSNPTGVQVIWLVCAASCLLGLLAFIPYKLGDTREETRTIMGL
jgi:Na+/melibiose symporter-like transporter